MCGTVKAKIQLLLLRQKEKDQNPKIKEMFPETHDNSESLKKWMSIALKLKNEGKSEEKVTEKVAEKGKEDKVKGKETESDHSKEHKHYRLVSGVYENRNLEQICCIDNEKTGTQAAIWSDSTHKQVRYSTLQYVLVHFVTCYICILCTHD